MRSERRQAGWLALLAGSCAALWIMASTQSQPSGAKSLRLQEIRNLGKALSRMVPTDQLGARLVVELLTVSGPPNEWLLSPASCSWGPMQLSETSPKIQSVAMQGALETGVRQRAAQCARQAERAEAARPELASC